MTTPPPAASPAAAHPTAAHPTPDAHPVISAHGLTKSFGSVRALDRLDLTIARGEVHGFLGPNGAGKSTTIRILLGLLRPDAGSVRIFDRDPWRDAVELHRRLAYVPGDVEVWPHLTGGEVIDMFLRLRGDYSARRRNALVDRFELDPRKKARTYSKGNRQKVALIAALAADVDLLLLDEPTAGLDPLMEAVFQEVIRERTAEGTSVLLSSHILSQVEALSDRVSIIRAGRIVESGSLTDLRHMSRTTIEVDTAQPAHDLAALDGRLRRRRRPGLPRRQRTGAAGRPITHGASAHTRAAPHAPLRRLPRLPPLRAEH
jgi:ABC-2 type transport system ATP-binding protein